MCGMRRGHALCVAHGSSSGRATFHSHHTPGDTGRKRCPTHCQPTGQHQDQAGHGSGGVGASQGCVLAPRFGRTCGSLSEGVESYENGMNQDTVGGFGLAALLQAYRAGTWAMGRMQLRGQTDTHSNVISAADGLGDPAQVTHYCSDTVSSPPQRLNIYKVSPHSRRLLNLGLSPPCFPLNQCKHHHLGLGTLQTSFLPFPNRCPGLPSSIYLRPSAGATSSRKPPLAALINTGLLLTRRLWCTPGAGGWWVWAHVTTAPLVSYGQ